MKALTTGTIAQYSIIPVFINNNFWGVISKPFYMNSYLRLYKLYESRNLTRPLEDFTTEVLAGILHLYPDIMDKFCKEILKVEGTGLRVKTQVTYPHEDRGVRVDLVIENGETLIFIENKVESDEGYFQLGRYADVLDRYTGSKQAFLFYCTKYTDPKDVHRHNFRQFRWMDVAQLLERRFPLPQVKDFLEFLKYYGMHSETNFELSDLVGMSTVTPLMRKMFDYLDLIRPPFTERFGKRINNPDIGLQLKRWGRVNFLKNPFFSSGAASEIGVGFDLNDEPKLYVWLWWAQGIKDAAAFNTAIQKSTIPFTWKQDGFATFKYPLKRLVNESDMRGSVLKWYEEKFDLMNQFIQENPSFGWRMD